MTLPAPFDHPRAVPAAIALVSAAALAAALIAEHVFGLAPCALCHYQRYAYVAALLLGLLGLFLNPRLLVALAGLAFVTGMGIAAFHVGVEQGWWQGTAGCSAPAFDLNATVDQMRESLLNTDFVACDKVAWSLFGISMAGYNALFSAIFALASFAAAAKMEDKESA
ncbi:MAG: disulfide bond formation protein B [Rhodovibrionaceae bacterium]